MKILFFFGCFSVVSGVSTPITQAALKHYMATWMSLRVQRLQMQNGYQRNHRPNRYQGRRISPMDLIKQLVFKFIFFFVKLYVKYFHRNLQFSIGHQWPSGRSWLGMKILRKKVRSVLTHSVHERRRNI